MKKAIWAIALFSIAINSIAQENEVIFGDDLMKSNDINLVYIPSTTDLDNVKESTIIINYQGTFSPGEIGAINYAVGIWEKILDTPINIFLDVEKASGISLTRGGFARYNSNDIGDPAFSDTWYPTALADWLSSHDVNPWQTDIGIKINNSSSTWYTGTNGNCPDTKWDLVTATMNAIGHGLGFMSSISADYWAGTAQYGGPNYYPFLFDRYIMNNEGIDLTDFPINSSTSYVYNYLTNTWVYSVPYSIGSNITLENSSMFYYSGGVGANHFHDIKYSNTNNALMTSYLQKGEAIHDIGPLFADLLKDFGWSVNYPLGIEDEVTMSGYYYAGMNSNGNPISGTISNWDQLPDLNQGTGGGQEYEFNFDFIDNYPYGDYLVSAESKFELLLENGDTYIVTESESISFLDVSISDINNIVSGLDYKWNHAGFIKAKISYTGIDNDGASHHATFNLFLPFEPNDCEIAFVKNKSSVGIGGSGNCSSVTLEFYSPGANNYNVMFKSENDFFYYTEAVTEGEFTHTISGLNKSLDYEFKVQAINELGYKLSETLYRSSCTVPIEVYPNPSTTNIMISSGQDIILQEVEVSRLDNPGILKKEFGNGSSQVNMNVHSLPPGSYNVKAIDIEGNISYKTIIIL